MSECLGQFYHFDAIIAIIIQFEFLLIFTKFTSYIESLESHKKKKSSLLNFIPNGPSRGEVNQVTHIIPDVKISLST